jgi:hypothetical protein
MINSFDDFCLWVYVLVDDEWQAIKDIYKQPRQAPVCSDSELLSMVLISECKGWDVETEALKEWKEHRDLFPQQPSQSRYNRRRRALADALKVIRQRVLAKLDVAYDRDCAVDSLPLGVVQFQHAPAASSTWREHEAQIGYVSAKKQYIFGYRLQSLVPLRGVIIDFMLVPAAYKDSEAMLELLAPHRGRRVLADKGFVNYEISQTLLQVYGVLLLALTRKNQKKHPLPALIRRILPHWRIICETLHSQLVQQLCIQRNHARSFDGFCARLLAKLTAHTLCIYLNRLLGNSDFLQIKQLAFPN